MLDSIKITLKSRFWRKKVVVYADGVILLPGATSYVTMQISMDTCCMYLGFLFIYKVNDFSRDM